MSLLLKAALAANLPSPKPEDFTGYQVGHRRNRDRWMWVANIDDIVSGLISIDCDHQVFSLTPHSPSQVSWLLELR